MGQKIRSKFRKPLSLAGLYYSHGLMCASYPRTVIAIVAIVVVTCSLPFFFTSSGDLNKPKPWRSPWLNYRVMTTPHGGGGGEGLEWIINKPSQFSGRTPSWFLGMPVALVQQLYVHLHINCERVGELCHKPYYSTSKLAAAHLITKMEHTISSCRSVMHPAILNLTHSLSLKRNSTHSTAPLPMGILSPVLDSYRTTWEDTPLDHHSIKELIYGGFWEYEHNSVDPVRMRQDDTDNFQEKGSKSVFSGRSKEHSFAITLMFLSKGRGDFKELVQCVEGLTGQWEEHKEEEEKGNKMRPLRFMKHLYYEPEWMLMDFAPLMSVYIIVFLYISFSVGKIDLVRSKVGLGFTAFITVLAALTMSLGICTFFGLSISLNGREIYPYVVITIGLENILIIVKAVMSTPEELEVKYRVAVGLSREGLAITRNLVTQVALTSFGIIIFNYVLKEFCIIAVVGLICDAFLQLILFPTVLSIDLRRLELSDLSSATVPIPDNMDKSHSHSSSSCRPRCPSSFQQVTTPMRWHSKRIKFIYFLARTRIVSRFLMVSLLVLLCVLLAKTDTFHDILARCISPHKDMPSNPRQPIVVNNRFDMAKDGFGTKTSTFRSTSTDRVKFNDHTPRERDDGGELSDTYWADLVSALDAGEVMVEARKDEDGFGVRCEDGEVCWRPMVTTHWPRLLNYTGYGTAGRFLTLLPPINLDFKLGHVAVPSTLPPFLLVHVLSYPLVIRLTIIVAIIAVFVSYTFYLIRASRFRHQRYMRSVRLKGYSRLTCLKGHTQDIDFMCVDGDLVVTSSLDGDLRVWDAHPMKRKCAQVISRGKLCHSPLPEVSSSSQRTAAEGCEATTHTCTPSSSTPTFTTSKYQGFFGNSRYHGSISSRSSSISDGCDYHGNGDQNKETRARLEYASKLSDMSNPYRPVQRTNPAPTEMLEGNFVSKSHIPLISQTTPSVPMSDSFAEETMNFGRQVYKPPEGVSVASNRDSGVIKAAKSTPLPSHSAPSYSTYQALGLNGHTHDALTAARSMEGGRLSLPHLTAQHRPQASNRNPSHPPQGSLCYDPSLNGKSRSVACLSTHSTQVNVELEPENSYCQSTPNSTCPTSVFVVTHGTTLTSPMPSRVTTVRSSVSPVSSTESVRAWSHSSEALSSFRTNKAVPSPNSCGPVSTAYSTRAMSTSNSSGALSTAYSTRAMSTSNSSGALSTAYSTRAMSTSESNGALSTAYSTRAMSTSESNGALSTAYSTRAMSTSDSSGALSTAYSTRAMSTSNSSGALSTAYSTRAMSTSDSSGAVYTSHSSGHSGTRHYHVTSVSSKVDGHVPTIDVSKATSVTALNVGPTNNSNDGTRYRYKKGHARHSSLGNNVSHHQPIHSRNRSLGSIIFSSIFSSPFPPRTLNCNHASLGNISVMSNNSAHESEISSTSFMTTPSNPKMAKVEKGYDFAQHFNLFSQYTSNMALEESVKEQLCEEMEQRGEEQVSPLPVWCMAVWNRVIVLGCKGGHVEAWHAMTGSLIFEQSIGRSGVCTIAVTTAGIVAGQMDGSLSVIGHNGLLHHVIRAHDRAVSILRWYRDSILVSGGYDSAIKVHRTSTPLHCQPVCVNSIFVHDGNISAMAIVKSQLKLGCVSGCSKGLVIHWDVNTGACINEFGMYSSNVLQLESTIASVVGLFGEGCLRVWDLVSGDLARRIVLAEVCHNFTLLSSQHAALCLESSIEVYDFETGRAHIPEVQLKRGVSCSSVEHCMQALDQEGCVVCSSGKDMYLIPCNLKLKND